MDNKIIFMIIVAIILGMLVANMFKDVCGCKNLIEGQCPTDWNYGDDALQCIPKSGLDSAPTEACHNAMDGMLTDDDFFSVLASVGTEWGQAWAALCGHQIAPGAPGHADLTSFKTGSPSSKWENLPAPCCMVECDPNNSTACKPISDTPAASALCTHGADGRPAAGRLLAAGWTGGTRGTGAWAEACSGDEDTTASSTHKSNWETFKYGSGSYDDGTKIEPCCMYDLLSPPPPPPPPPTPVTLQDGCIGVVTDQPAAPTYTGQP